MAERMEIGRILVAVADDHSSDAALAEGVRLAQVHGAELRLVHVVDTAPRFVGPVLPDLEEVAERAREAGQETIAQAWIAALRRGVRAEVALLEQPVINPAGDIVAEAGRWRADIVVIGRHARAGLRGRLHVRVSEPVARAAHCAVLVVAAADASRAA